MHFTHGFVPLQFSYQFYACLILVGGFGGLISFCLASITINGTGGIELVLSVGLLSLYLLVRVLMSPLLLTTTTMTDDELNFLSSDSNNKYKKKIHELTIDTRILTNRNDDDKKLISSSPTCSSSCSICLQGFEIEQKISTATVCHHTYHTNCLKMWIPKSTTCPYCRQDLDILPPVVAKSNNPSSTEVRKFGFTWEIFEGIFDSLYDYPS